MATQRARGRRGGASRAAPPPPELSLPVRPPIDPMLCKAHSELPQGRGWLFEPKWDGFRALVFRDGDTLYMQSRDLRPLDRYFPELTRAFLEQLPERSVLDGEIVIATPNGLDFPTLQMRLHPAASRVEKLSAQTPASFVAFDALVLDGEDLRELPQAQRRARLEAALAHVRAPIHLTPFTRDVEQARDWFQRFEGAGLDGVIAKREEQTYVAGARAMLKIKHARTCDCVVAGFRWHKGGEGERVGSLLLGLHDADGALQHVGITATFTMAKRRALVSELEPLREGALEAHPWSSWAEASRESGRMPGGKSRWSGDKDLSWVPLRCERVVEVKFDHLEGSRFRHASTFVRWRPDRSPESCTYDQIDVTPPYELARIFAQGSAT